MKITIEVPDISLAAKALNNAAVAFWYECHLPERFGPMKNLSQEEDRDRFNIVKSICEQVEAIEKLGYTPTTIDSPGQKEAEDFVTKFKANEE